MKLREAASCLRESIGEATTYQLLEFPMEHWRLIRTNNMIERLNREIRRRTRVVGQFPDGQGALMLVTARVRHVTQDWPERRYLDMSPLEPIMDDTVETPHEATKAENRKCATYRTLSAILISGIYTKGIILISTDITIRSKYQQNEIHLLQEEN